MTLLEARQLTRRGEAGRLLIDAVDLELVAGERLALGGPSGAGKTQLLRALALLDPLEAGEILWRGGSVGGDRIPQYRSRVIYHQQRPALFEGSVEENLRRPFELGAHRARSFERGRAEEWMARLGRPDLLDEPTSAELSGGERQIVGLIRLLLVDPEVALLDEPTASLDPTTEERVAGLLAEWVAAHPRRAYVWVTHDRVLASRVGHRSAEVTSGRLRLESVDG